MHHVITRLTTTNPVVIQVEEREIGEERERKKEKQIMLKHYIVRYGARNLTPYQLLCS